MTSSFIQRRLGLIPNSLAVGLDQIRESLFPLLGLRVAQIFSIIPVFFLLELILSRILFLLNIRTIPY